MRNSSVATTTTGICTVIFVKMAKRADTSTTWSAPEAVKITAVLRIVTGVYHANFVKTSLTMKTVPTILAEI